MLHQKMRPQTFDDMVGQEVTVENIRNQSISGLWFQVYFLGGQYGSGKTTLARLIARAANCINRDERGNPCQVCVNCRADVHGNPDIREIDGASNTGVDNIRQLQEWMEYKPFGRKKVVIIDEVHMLSTSAFNSLLKMLEEPPSYAMFILVTTDIESIPTTVRSRSAEYVFGQIPVPMITKHLETVAAENGILIDQDACMLIAKRSNGAMRNALVYLEQMSASGERITVELSSRILGIPRDDQIIGIIESFLSHNVVEFVKITENLGMVGKNYSILSKELLSACSDLLLASALGVDHLSGTDHYKSLIGNLVNRYCLEEFCRLSNQVKILCQAVSKDESQNWFIVNGIFSIQQMVNQPERQGIKSEPSVSTSQQNTSFVTGTTTIPEASNEPPKAADADDEEDDDLWGEWEVDEDFHLEYDNPKESKVETEEICQAEKKVPQSKAEILEEQLLRLAQDEPETDVHLKLCDRRYDDNSGKLVLLAPNKSVGNLLMLFLGRKGITDVNVVFGAD